MKVLLGTAGIALAVGAVIYSQDHVREQVVENTAIPIEIQDEVTRKIGHFVMVMEGELSQFDLETDLETKGE